MRCLRACRPGAFFALGLVLTGASCSNPPADSLPPPARTPDHVMVLVFDQMRPDYIDRFGMRNFQRLRASGRDYRQAYVGHLGAQTVVSHLVISTGLLPKMFPWQDDVLLDQVGALGKPNAAYETGGLTREQFWTLLKPLPSTTYLPQRIRESTGRRVIAVGEKDYATLMLGTPAADAIVTLTKTGRQCTPSGVNVPDYIAGNPRFTLECAEPVRHGADDPLRAGWQPLRAGKRFRAFRRGYLDCRCSAGRHGSRGLGRSLSHVWWNRQGCPYAR